MEENAKGKKKLLLVFPLLSFFLMTIIFLMIIKKQNERSWEITKLREDFFFEYLNAFKLPSAKLLQILLSSPQQQKKFFLKTLQRAVAKSTEFLGDKKNFLN